MLQEFILYKRAGLVLAGTDGSGFSCSTASYYCTKRVRLRRNLLKIVVCADMDSRLICTPIIHHDMWHDSPDFLPLLYKTNAAAPVDTVSGDVGLGDENNHVGARKAGTAATIPTGHADVPIHRTSGIHRKEMKRNLPRQSHSQGNKSETVFFVVKRMMSGDITSRNGTTQDNEILLGLIAHNAYRVTKLGFVVLAWFLQGLKDASVLLLSDPDCHESFIK